MFKSLQKSFKNFVERRKNPFGLTDDELKKCGFSVHKVSPEDQWECDEDQPWEGVGPHDRLYTKEEVNKIKKRGQKDGLVAGILIVGVYWAADKVAEKIVEKLYKD